MESNKIDESIKLYFDRLEPGRLSNWLKNPTELCKLAYKYGSDKCPLLKHPFTPFYYQLLKDKRQSIKKVLEIGVGDYKGMRFVKRKKGSYVIGASLYMWRDFFPKAQIYGADIAPEVMFTDERITTYPCDQTNKNNLNDLIYKYTGTDIDLLIDDGSHQIKDQIFTCQYLLPLISKNVIYIIEDVTYPLQIVSALKQFECWVPNLPMINGDDRLVVITNKNNK